MRKEVKMTDGPQVEKNTKGSVFSKEPFSVDRLLAISTDRRFVVRAGLALIALSLVPGGLSGCAPEKWAGTVERTLTADYVRGPSDLSETDRIFIPQPEGYVRRDEYKEIGAVSEVSEIFEIFKQYPWLSLKIDGRPVLGVDQKPLTFCINQCKWTDSGWQPDPQNVPAFCLEPGIGSCSGNCFGLHNGFLKDFGTYVGVYETDNGSTLLGQQGYVKYKIGEAKIKGLTRFPLAPGSNDRLVLYPARLDQNGRNTGADLNAVPAEFQCTAAKIVSAAEGDKIWWNSESNKGFMISCYPPEENREHPVGRVLTELTLITKPSVS